MEGSKIEEYGFPSPIAFFFLPQNHPITFDPLCFFVPGINRTQSDGARGARQSQILPAG